MKGGGSRLNVNTDKPHSLISIKNKVLPTSPPARQSPQATPTAARSWRPGEREPGEPLAAPRRLPGPRFPRPPPRHRGVRPPAGRGAGLRAGTPRATPPGHALPSRPAPRVRTPRRRTPSCERTRLGLPASRARRGLDGGARGGGGWGRTPLPPGFPRPARVGPAIGATPTSHPPLQTGPPPPRRSRTRGRSTTTTITSEPDLLRPRSLLNPGKNVSFTWPRAAGARAPGGGFSAPT